jgi:Zn-dependent protease
LGGISDTFTPLSIVYLFGAGFTVYQMAKGWRQFRSGQLTPFNRRLASGIAFFLLVPVGVLLHEWGHMLAAWSTGGTVLGLHYFLYWGYVEYIPASSDPLPIWWVSLAGNLVSYLLGIACIAAGLLWRSAPPVARAILLQLGILELAQTLIFYPLISLDPSFNGDWDTIYSFDAPVASTLTLVVHVLSLAGMVWLFRKNDEVSELTGA